MGIADFLFNGSPPPTTTKYENTTTQTPAWYSDYVQGLISKSNAIASTPYQAYGGQRIAQTSSDQQAAYDQTRGLGQQFANNFNPALQTVAGMQGPNAPSALGQYGAQNYYNQAGGINSMAASQPSMMGANALTLAGGLTPASAGINNYMSPYQSQVVDEIARRGQENIANAQSGVADKFIGGGQFGSSRMGRSLGNAQTAGLRDILGQQATALNSGYGQALGASQADLTRQLQAGSQLGTLGTNQANIANQYSQNLANIGQSLGTFGQSDLQRQLDAAKGQGALAEVYNTNALRNIAAQEAVGNTQQAQQQKNLDIAYQDFVAQRDNPQQMASFMNNIIRGLQIPAQTTTQGTGPATVLNPSPLTSIVGAGATGLGIYNQIK